MTDVVSFTTRRGKLSDLAGVRFGRLVVEGLSHSRVNPSRMQVFYWKCKCDCGGEKTVQTSQLTRGRTNSCGCLHREHMSSRAKHGMAASAEYRIYYKMIDRCHGETRERITRRYKDRGITVCNRWRFGENDKSGFECFVQDMGARPSPLYSIDRVNNDLGYSPDNCRWATRQQQSANREFCRMIDLPDGRSVCLSEAARYYGLNQRTLRYRLNRGWSLEAAIAKPVGRQA